MEQAWTRLVERILHAPGSDSGAVVAFSGGVDSAVVLRAARQALSPAPVYAVFFSTALHPAAERREAEELARSLHAQFCVIEIDEFSQAGIETNPPDRCYRCKRLLFSRLRAFADEHGVQLTIDGTNADDLNEYRPGLRALRECGVTSPLAELGFSKATVRELASLQGLRVAHKPSSPCLATRLEYGAPLRRETLNAIARAEEALHAMGFDAVRVRLHRQIARVEIADADLLRAVKKRGEITQALHECGFLYVTLDLDGLRSGSMDLLLSKEEKALGLNGPVSTDTEQEATI